MGVIVGLVPGVIVASDGFALDMMGAPAAPLAAGVPLVRHPRPRDRRPLPVPAYGTLSNPRPPETQEQLAAAEHAIVAELRASAAREGTRRARLAMLARASYAALQDRDYLRAHVAARLALEGKAIAIEAGPAYPHPAAGPGDGPPGPGRTGGGQPQMGLSNAPAPQGG